MASKINAFLQQANDGVNFSLKPKISCLIWLNFPKKVLNDMNFKFLKISL